MTLATSATSTGDSGHLSDGPLTGLKWSYSHLAGMQTTTPPSATGTGDSGRRAASATEFLDQTIVSRCSGPSVFDSSGEAPTAMCNCAKQRCQPTMPISSSPLMGHFCAILSRRMVLLSMESALMRPRFTRETKSSLGCVGRFGSEARFMKSHWFVSVGEMRKND